MEQNKLIMSEKGMTYLSTDKEYYDAELIEVHEAVKGITLVTTIGEFDCKNDITITPQAGDTVRFYGKGIGHRIRGLTIIRKKGKTKAITVLFYRTPEEDEENFQQYLNDQEAREIAYFEKNKEHMDKEVEALPDVFKKRLERLRKEDPKFRWSSESYELLIYKDAIKIANKLKSVEAINCWKQMSWDGQRKIVNIDPNHSGHTYSCAVELAKQYILNPESII